MYVFCFQINRQKQGAENQEKRCFWESIFITDLLLKNFTLLYYYYYYYIYTLRSEGSSRNGGAIF